MNARLILGLDAAMLTLWGLGIAVGAMSFFWLGFLLLGIIVWAEGGLRFARIRRWSQELARTVGQLARMRRPSPTALRHLGIVVGVLLAIVLLNQLRLRAPGQGRGLSIPTNGIGMDLSFSSAGGAFVSMFWLTILLAMAGAIWLRLWRPVAQTQDAWRVRAYWVCLALFVVLPLAYWAATLAGPEDPKANVRYAQTLMRILLSVLAVAFVVVIALPFLGARRTPPLPGATPMPR